MNPHNAPIVPDDADNAPQRNVRIDPESGEEVEALPDDPTQEEETGC